MSLAELTAALARAFDEARPHEEEAEEEEEKEEEGAAPPWVEEFEESFGDVTGSELCRRRGDLDFDLEGERERERERESVGLVASASCLMSRPPAPNRCCRGRTCLRAKSDTSTPPI